MRAGRPIRAGPLVFATGLGGDRTIVADRFVFAQKPDPKSFPGFDIGTFATRVVDPSVSVVEPALQRFASIVSSTFGRAGAKPSDPAARTRLRHDANSVLSRRS